jgi:predicted ATP-dependent endonuclease of OLD family
VIKLASKKETKQTALSEKILDEKEEEDAFQISGGYVGRTGKSEGLPFHISKLTIKNFKSISEILVELPRVGILTGPNNCGKSTILQAITLGFECLARNRDFTTGKIKKGGSSVPELSSVPVNHPRSLWYNNKWQEIHSGRRVERKPIEIGIEFTNDTYFTSYINFYYGFLNLNVKDYSANFKYSGELARLINSAPLVIPGIPGLLRHETPLLPAVMSEALHSGKSSQVLRNVLYSLKSNPAMFKVIERAMSHHFGLNLREIEYDEKFGLEIKVPYAEKDNEFEIISAGSGLHQILQLVALLTWSKSSIILLDEPDSHLHTSLQKKLFMFLDDLSREFDLQLLIATHSRDFLASAPIDSIIPVDITERCLKPMQSMEHLLTEFKRQGELSNLDIACLYNSKSCLFVERTSDSDILITLAERLGSDIFSGEKQAIMFPFKGKDKMWSIPTLVDIFQSMIGAEIRWFLLRDRDALAPEIMEGLYSKLENLGIANHHIWNMYEIENYLLDLRPITRIINSDGNSAVEDDIEKLIIECCKKTLSEITPTIIVENQNEYKDLFNDVRTYQTKGAEIAQKYMNFASLSNDNLKSVVSGKKVFSKLFQQIQKDYGVNIRTIQIARAIQKEEIHKEVIEFFKKLDNALH